MPNHVDIYQADYSFKKNAVKLRYMCYATNDHEHEDIVNWCEKQFGPIGNAERWWYDRRFSCVWVGSEEDRTLIALAFSKK